MQLLLLITGLVLGVYILFTTFYMQRKKANVPAQEENEGDDPLLQGYDILDEDEEAAQPEIQEMPEVPEVIPQVSPEYIMFTILPQSQGVFAGHLLSATLRANHFYYSQGLFHYHLNEDAEQPILFSLASIVEPGTFDPKQMIRKTYPGMVIYMQVSKGLNPSGTFEKMLMKARKIAASLNAQICTDRREALTLRRISDYHERIKQRMHAQA